MARGSEWLHDSTSLHDREQENESDNLEDSIDEGEEQCDRANILEGLPRICVLSGLSRPDIAHDENPQDVHNDRHNSQTHQLYIEASY